VESDPTPVASGQQVATPPGDITQLLWKVGEGNTAAEAELAILVYKELHGIAERLMRSERVDHMLQPTALVNEAYVRLLAGNDPDWQNRTHFFGFAGQIMRRILVDYARAQQSEKRGGRVQHVELEAWEPEARDAQFENSCEDLIAVDDALSRLETLDPRQSRIVELKFFMGMSEEEIAMVLDVSDRTVRREWKFARAWLYCELRRFDDPGELA